jgi:hypothetical protein
MGRGCNYFFKDLGGRNDRDEWRSFQFQVFSFQWGGLGETVETVGEFGKGETIPRAEATGLMRGADSGIGWFGMI